VSKIKVQHRCSECGTASPRWTGRCPTCGAWNALVEEVRPAAVAVGQSGGTALASPVALGDVDCSTSAPRPTGIAELDRVLGGGLVPGSVTLVGGEPGIGKSTLLLQALCSMVGVSASGSTGNPGPRRCLLVSAEESAQQVKRRAGRLGLAQDNLWLLAETSIQGIRQAVEQLAPEMLVVDSIQTVWDPDLGSAPGSVAQVRGCAQELVTLAKTRDMATVMIGHVTKDGSIAGPRTLEHVVDTVLSFEGERHHVLRLLRAVKHRFGPTGELGLFEMTADGLTGVADPSALFLGDRSLGASGSMVFPAMEGQRPLLVELQALVNHTQLPMPRRSASGLDASRLSLLVAVLERRAQIVLTAKDVFASAVGGVRVSEPGADLALCLALASAALEVPLPPNLVALGEVGLAGELRLVSQTPRRLAEAARLGFEFALVPQSAPDDGPLRLLKVRSLSHAVDILVRHKSPVP
jgi:DNA repair protein RadA/Sms